jgi:hypothetical protein
MVKSDLHLSFSNWDFISGPCSIIFTSWSKDGGMLDWISSTQNDPMNFDLCFCKSSVLLYPHSQSGGYTGIPLSVRPSVRPSLNFVYVTSHLSFVAFYSYLVSWLAMRILYRFHEWLIFARDIALFMFVWPYVRSHILCTQLVICLLSHFIHIWYLNWPWSEHAHIVPISRMVDFCESYSPFHVCLTIRPSAHLVYATSLLSHFIHIWYLDWPWSEHAHIIPISRMVDFCKSYSPFHVPFSCCYKLFP